MLASIVESDAMVTGSQILKGLILLFMIVNRRQAMAALRVVQEFGSVQSVKRVITT